MSIINVRNSVSNGNIFRIKMHSVYQTTSIIRSNNAVLSDWLPTTNNNIGNIKPYIHLYVPSRLIFQHRGLKIIGNFKF